MTRLILSLKRVYFDQIASGEKKQEYREAGLYWRSRLMTKQGQVRQFDEVEFRNGYGLNVPRMVLKCEGISLLEAEKLFIIRLGRRLS